MAASLKVGETVATSDGHQAIVRFAGETSFAPGEWLGVEFTQPIGKNDGSVRGSRYFSCQPGYGMFVRPSTVTRASPQPEPPTEKANVKSVGQNPKGRPPSATLKSTGLSSKSSSTTRPSSVSSRKTSTSNAMPPTIQRPPSISSSRSNTNRQSVSMSTRPSLSSTTIRQTSSTKPSLDQQTSSTSPPINAIGTAKLRTVSKTLPGSNVSSSTSLSSQPKQSSNSRPISVSRGRPSLSSNSSKTPEMIIASLQAEVDKMQVWKEEASGLKEEASRLQSALRDAEHGRDHFEKVIQKLQSKYQPMQQERIELKKQLQELDSLLESREAEKAEFDSILEMATLDREMAEERADAIERERDYLKRRIEELELETEILKEENEVFTTKISAEDRASQGWLALETENERLRAAIIQLRDVTVEDRERSKEELQSAEEERDGYLSRLTEAEKALEHLSELEEKLDQCEKDREHLREELEVASAADFVIPNLLEEVEHWKDQYEKLAKEFELIEELQAVHQETESTLQADIAQLETQLAQRDEENIKLEATVRVLEDNASDQQTVITKFRNLVVDLKYDLESVKASNDITEAEAEELNRRARELMNANQDFQTHRNDTVSQRNQLELQMLKAEEASEHLEIAKLFVPTAFLSESDSIKAYLLFKRISRQSSLLAERTKEKALAWNPQVHREYCLYALGVMDTLTWMADASVSLEESVYGRSVEGFAEYATALYDLAPVEDVLLEYINGFKMDEPCEDRMHRDLLRVGKILAGVCDKLLDDSQSLPGFPRMWHTGLVLKVHMENTTAALTYIRDEITARTVMQRDSIENEDASQVAGISNPSPQETTLDESPTSISSIESKLKPLLSESLVVKGLVERILRSLQELKTRRLVLDGNTWALFGDCRLSTMELAHYSCAVGEALRRLSHDEARVHPATLEEIENAFLTIPFGTESTNGVDLFVSFSNALSKTSKQLSDLCELAADFRNTVEFSQVNERPWEASARICKEEQLNHALYENMVRRYQNEVRARVATLNERNQQIDEQNLKIEHLEARLIDVHGMHERITTLHIEVTEAKANEAILIAEIDKLREVLDEVSRDREVYAAEVAQRRIEEADIAREPIHASSDSSAWESRLESMKLIVRGLETANDFLRAAISQRAETSMGDETLPLAILPADASYILEKDSAYYSESGDDSSHTKAALWKSMPINSNETHRWNEANIFGFGAAEVASVYISKGGLRELQTRQESISTYTDSVLDPRSSGFDITRFMDSIINTDWRKEGGNDN